MGRARFYKWKEEATQLKKKVEELEIAASKQPSIISQGVSSAMQMLGFRPGGQAAQCGLGGLDGMLGVPPPMAPQMAPPAGPPPMPPIPPVLFLPGGQTGAHPPVPPFTFGAAQQQPQKWAADDWQQGCGGAGSQRPQEPVWHQCATPGGGVPLIKGGPWTRPRWL